MQQYRKNLGKVSLTAEGAWNLNNSYDILSIVYDEHTQHGFISRKAVPQGVDLYNKEYWMPLNVSGYADNNVIILSKKTSEASIQSYTLEEAITSIKSVGRRPGAILGFYNENNDRLDIGGRWELWQFNDTNVYNWENVDSWQNLYYNYNKFMGWFKDENFLNKYAPFPEIGCYAFVGSEFNEATVYRCDNKYVWNNTAQHAWDYVKVIVDGNVTVGENGNWFNNGEDTGIPASVKGENGKTPVFREKDNTIQYSFDNVNWITISDKVAAWFRWNATTGDTQANNVGRIQISRDNVTWTNLSGDIINNLHISRYIGADEVLPTSGIAEGTIYAKGPTYADGDSSHANPIYRLWVYAWKGNTLAWQDNGEFTSIAAGVVQETGDSETEVMSQKAVSEKLSELGSQVINVSLVGKGKDGVFQKLTLPTAGRTYRIFNKYGDWDTSSILSEIDVKLQIYYSDADDNLVIPISVLSGKEVNDWYDITIPNDVKPKYLYIYIRANEGEILNFVVEDITGEKVYNNCLVYNDEESVVGKEYPIKNNGYIPINSVVDIKDSKFSSNFVYEVIPCKNGDTFFIKAKGGVGTGLLFALIDEDGNRITSSTEAADYSEKGYYFVCYKDGYLIINCYVNLPHRVIKVDTSISQTSPIVNLTNQAYLTDGYILHNSGTSVNSSDMNYKTGYLPTLGYEKIKLTVNNATSDSVSTGIAFYDKYRNFIQGIPSIGGKDSAGISVEQYTIPPNAYTFRTTIFKEFASELNIELISSDNDTKEYPLDYKGFYDGYINSTGKLGSVGTSTQNKITGRINVEGFVQVRVLMNYGLNAENTTGLVFFDKDNNPIVGHTSPTQDAGVEHKTIEQIISIPGNAAYAITTIRNEYKDDFYIYGIKSKKLYNQSIIDKVSDYREDVTFHRRYSNCRDFGAQPSADGSNESFCNVNTGTYNDIINEIYEPLRIANPNYIKRTSIGLDSSGTIEMFVYEFEPRYYQQHVYLQAGIHGDEPDAIACLARIMQMITNATDEQTDLMFLRQNIKFTVVPCVNVWGFSQSPKKRQAYDDKNMQQWNADNDTAPNEIINIRNYVENILPELSFMVDMHTTTNDTYYDFYANIQPNSKNVRTIYRTNAWLCDRYALDGRTIDDQYIGYYQANNNLFRIYYYDKGVETATIELSDYHWDNKLSTAKVITMGVTMFLNYIIQMCNDFYKSMYNIPYEDYRKSRG